MSKTTSTMPLPVNSISKPCDAGTRSDGGWIWIRGQRIPIAIRTAYQEGISSLLDLSSESPLESFSSIAGPLEPILDTHPKRCWCASCWNVGVQYADYVKQKKLNEL